MMADMRAWFLDDKKGAARILDDTLARHPISTLRIPYDYAGLAHAYGLAGRPDAERTVVSQWQQARKSRSEMADSSVGLIMKAGMAMTAGRYDEGIAAYRAAAVTGCESCTLPEIGRAFDLSGKPDSAIASFTRYLATGEPARQYLDGIVLAGIHKRLGELYEGKENRADALSHYNTFLALWKDADPELQPKVQEVRQRVSRLSKSSEKR